MIENELAARRQRLIKITDQLLAADNDSFRKLTPAEQKTLEKTLLEIEALDIKVTGSDNIMNNHASHSRKKKNISNNSQYKLPL